MRPLHRPMFRYGGPIKEGVMSGIKEPVRKAALVGNSVYPQTGGREHHNWVKTLLGFGTRAGAGTGASQATKKTVGTEAAKGIKSLGTKIKNWWQKPPSTGTKMGEIGGGKDAWKIGKGFQEMKIPPGVGTNRWYWEKGVLPTAGAAKWAAGKALPYATTGGLLFTGGMWLKPDGTPANKDEIKKNVKTSGPGKVPGANSDLYWQDPEKAELRADKLRKDRIQKYRDIMDIKGMNKEAAANSLIEASRLINESGDFKGDIKSGSLINKIIGATSKAFDKPADTKRAIDTLILKGEIEKDINQSKGTAAFQAIDALAQASGKSHKYVANQKLGVPNTVGESVAQLKKIKKLPTSDDVATQVYSFSEQSGVPVQKHITTEQKNEIIGKDKKYASLTELISKEEFTKDGYYIIGTSVIEVKDGVPRIKA